MEQDQMMGRDRDLVLPPNTYAYVLDSTKGKVSIYVGPYKNSLSNTDQLVVWNARTHRFEQVTDVDRAITTFQMAREGQYIVLSNPAANGAAGPPSGNSTEAVELDAGRQVNVPGPITFSLWPGQTAQTIDGHHLRHNQYLIVRVYDPQAATDNWESGVIATQADTDATEVVQDLNFAMGQLIVIKGTDVAFYIPPTGIEVVPEAGIAKTGTSIGSPGSEVFVREAVTLERLEYCILLDENGEKRYLQGPDVVFPRPTEKFVQHDDGTRKFKAIELNPHSGLFIKVIAEYTENGTTHHEGDELFITGAETAIYFPRAEHSIIMYGDKRVHHAVAIPAGEGRYVLDRDLGTVDLIQGPKMFLPDPRKQVVVLRILDKHIVELYYPGNEEALEINEHYAEVSSRLDAGTHLSNVAATASAAAYGSSQTNLLRSAVPTAAFAGSEMKRSTTYTPPRSIVLDTKYEGAVAVNVWPGYAVLVVNKTDDRRVEVGPKMVLLQYDEQLMPLTLSTGRPKNDRNLLRTAYLRIVNNQVSDRVMVETRDLVSVTLDVSYRVNFTVEDEGDEHDWFAIENYVKVLTDHCRSRLRNEAKRHGIQEFYTQTIDIIRDTLLGPATDDAPRKGMRFDENGMNLYDVEVLNVQIGNEDVGHLLIEAQTDALTGAIELSTAEDTTVRTTRLEELRRSNLDQLELTAAKQGEIAVHAIQRTLEHRLAGIASEFEQAEQMAQVTDLTLLEGRKVIEQDIELMQARDKATVERLVAETTEYLRRVEALNPHVVVAMQQFGDQAFVERLVAALGPAAMAAGVTTADLFSQLFKGTPFEETMNALTARPLAILNGQREEITVS